MTPPDPQQVAEIAGRLSKAQREGLQNAWRSATGVMLVSDQCEGAPLRALENDGLVNDALGLSTLGLAVRNFIQGNHHD